MHSLVLSLDVPTDPNLALVVKVLPAVLVILVTSALCGQLAVVLRQPRVLGEMVSGVLLGPTLLGALFPEAQRAIFSPQVKPILYVLSTLGLTLFMFLVGAGIDHGSGGGGRQGRNGLVLALSGMLPALTLGGLTGVLLHDRLSLSGVGVVEFALFLGGALSLTAFPMLARILYERGLENSRLGKLSLMAASIDDAAAWCFLAVITAMHARSGMGGAMTTIGLGVLFALVMLLGVRPMLRSWGQKVARSGTLGTNRFYVIMAIVLGAGFFTDLIGIYSVFGGFVAGLCMPRTAAFTRQLRDRMMDVVCVLLLPIFFAFSGLNTQLTGLASWALLLPFLAILAAGFVGKYFGCAWTMHSIGFSWRESYAVGGLMNARGLMILIFINIGLAQGIISQALFSMLVLVAVVTTGLAMPLYRLAIPPRLENELSSARWEPRTELNGRRENPDSAVAAGTTEDHRPRP